MSKIQTNKIQHTANGAAEFTLPTADGSSGQFLKTNASGVLSFATVDTSIADGSITAAKLASGVAGSIKHISTTSITSTSSDVTISNAFNEYPVYRIYLLNVRCTSSNRDLLMRCRDSGGDMTSDHRSRASHSLGYNFSNTDEFRLNYQATGDSYSQVDFFGEINLTGFAANKTLRYHGLTSYQQDDGDPEGDFVNGCCYRSEAVIGLKFFWNAGSFSGSTGGKISLYGVNNA